MKRTVLLLCHTYADKRFDQEPEFKYARVSNRICCLALIAVLLGGCVRSEPWYRTISVAKRYEGHITVGVTYFSFVPLRAHEARFPENVPHNILRFLDKAPLHPDRASETGDARSAFVEVIAREIDDEEGYGLEPRKRIRILRVERIGLPTKEYIASRALE